MVVTQDGNGDLNMRVTRAIIRAEQCTRAAAEAWEEVARAEQELAASITPRTRQRREQRIAIRGMVTAMNKAERMRGMVKK